MTGLIWAWVNLILFVGLLSLALRKKVVAFVATRHDTIKKDVIGTREQLRNAKSRLEEFSSKLSAVDAEVKSLTAQAAEDAGAVKSKLLNLAKEKSGTLVEEARSHSVSLYSDLKSDLVKEIAEKVIVQTEKNLRGKLTDSDLKRIRNEFTVSLNGSQRVRGEA